MPPSGNQISKLRNLNPEVQIQQICPKTPDQTPPTQTPDQIQLKNTSSFSNKLRPLEHRINQAEYDQHGQQLANKSTR